MCRCLCKAAAVTGKFTEEPVFFCPFAIRMGANLRVAANRAASLSVDACALILPNTKGMRRGRHTFSAGAYTANLPVPSFIIAVGVINMLVFLAEMFGFPVTVPIITHYADIVTASGLLTVLRTAILTKLAERTHGSAIAAHCPALAADIGTLLAGLTFLTERAAIAAMPSAVNTDGCAALTHTAGFANRAAFAAGVPAIRADIGIVFTVVAVFAQTDTILAHVTIRAMCIRAARTLSAAFTVAFSFLMARFAFGTMFVVLSGALCTHFAVVAPVIKACIAFIALRAYMFCILIARFAIGAMLFFIDGTFHAHFAIIAPFIHTFGAITAARAAFIVTHNKACSAVLASSFIFQVANQTGIRTTAFALVAAFKAAVAEQAVVTVTMALFAVRAVLFFIYGAFHAHFAVIAPFIHTFGAISATRTAFIVTHNKACSAVLASSFVFQMANQADIGTTVFALIAAIKAAVAKQAVIIVSVTLLAVGAVFSFVNGAFYAHAAVAAPFVYAFAAKTAAAGTRRMIRKTVSAFRAV